MILLKLLIEYLEDPAVSSTNAVWLYVILSFVPGFLKATAEGRSAWLGTKLAIRLRGIIVGEIFSTSLKRKITADASETGSQKAEEEAAAKNEIKSTWTHARGDNHSKQATAGKILNFMAVNSAKIAKCDKLPLHAMGECSGEPVTGAALLYSILSYASIDGLAIMVLLMPVKVLIARSFSRIQGSIMAATDADSNDQ